MSGRLLRFLCTTAVISTVVTAAPALADPEPGQGAPGQNVPGHAAEAAQADPTTTVTTTDPTATDPTTADQPAGSTAPADSPPSATSAAPTSAATLLDRLKTLYQGSEAAGQTYAAAAEAVKRQQAATRKVGAALAKARKELADSRNAAGELAREQYRSGAGLALSRSPYLRLMFSDHPQEELEEDHRIARASADQLAQIKRLRDVERRADALNSRSRAALAKQRKLAADRKKAHDTAEAGLHEAEALLAGFTPGQTDDVAALDRADTAAAQHDLVGSGVLSGPQASASAQGTAAMVYAVAQVGKAYAWGAAGPDSFDCSGLTQQAWAHAGRSIPRTSQEQWHRLPKVSLNELRPGDLVVYHPDATHVALYIGNGTVVQAARPGARVEISPLATAPVLGAVRPDAGPAGAPKAPAAPAAAQPAETSAR